MRQTILAGMTAVTFAIGTTSSAMAFDQGTAGKGRLTGVRGFSEWRHGGWSSHRFVGGHGGSVNGSYSGAHHTDLGPLGVRFGDYGSGSGYGSSIAAWSR